MENSVSNKGAYLISLFYEMFTSFTVVCGLRLSFYACFLE